MSTLKVNAIRQTAASSDAVTLASDGTCTVKATNNLSNRNLIINGDFKIAQRGTSSGSSGYKTVDRWQMSAGGANAALTQTQHALTSSDTGPWEKGFRHSFHILNAGQSGPDAGDYLELYTYLEDQNISQSGWNYASSSSYLTISFWVKSSVAQKFYGFLYTNQAGAGDSKMYSFVIDNGSGGNLSANTWTKITHTIDGDSSLTFNNDNTNGLAVGIFPFDGTDYTTSGHSLNTWAAWDSTNKVPDMTSTWWTTSSATFEITGVQLEVGDVATDFEHRSYGDELARCQRYYYQETYTDNYHQVRYSFVASSTQQAINFDLPVPMRTAPTVTNNGNGNFRLNDYANDETCNGMTTSYPNTHMVILKFTKATGNMTGGKTGVISTEGNNDAALYFSAEL